MKRISILLFFIALMMPPCHEPGTSMAQDATECLDTFPQQCGESIQLARLTLPMVGVSVPAAGGGCTTYNDLSLAIYGGATNDNNSITSTFWVADRITTPSGGVHVTGYVVNLSDPEAAHNTVLVEIMTDSSDNPSGSVVSGSAQIVVSDGNASAHDYEVHLSSPVALTGSTNYWIVVRDSDTPISTAYAATQSGGVARYSTNAGGAWNDFGSNTTAIKAKVLGCNP